MYKKGIYNCKLINIVFEYNKMQEIKNSTETKSIQIYRESIVMEFIYNVVWISKIEHAEKLHGWEHAEKLHSFSNSHYSSYFDNLNAHIQLLSLSKDLTFDQVVMNVSCSIVTRLAKIWVFAAKLTTIKFKTQCMKRSFTFANC